MKLKHPLLLILLSISLSISAAHRSTPEEAKALFEKAVAAYQSDDKQSTLKKFNEKKGEFTRGDLYVFAIDEAGNYLASGANPNLTGTPLKGTNDAAGNSIFDLIIEALAKDRQPATLDYVWLNRQTNQIESKTSYVKNIEGVILGVGYYH